MASIFGMNPVKGGSPAKEIRIMETDSCMVGEIIVIFLNCFEVFRFNRFSNMNRGIIKEQ